MIDLDPAELFRVGPSWLQCAEMLHCHPTLIMGPPARMDLVTFERQDGLALVLEFERQRTTAQVVSSLASVFDPRDGAGFETKLFEGRPFEAAEQALLWFETWTVDLSMLL